MDHWPELWKLISDVSKVERNDEWDLICEDEELDEDKAKKLFCDKESEWCLRGKDAKSLRNEVCAFLRIWTDEHEAESIEIQRQDKLAR